MFPDSPQPLANKKSSDEQQDLDIEYYEDELDEAEIEELKERDKKVNAKLASFKNLLTVQTIGNYLKYLVGAGKASLDAKMFLLNRENRLVQDIFNMADIKMVRKLRSITLDGVRHVVKFFISPGVFAEQLTLRRNHPVWPRN